MKSMGKDLVRFLMIALMISFTLTACEEDDDKNNDEMNNDLKSIVSIASETSDFSTLVAALTKADLVSTLEGDGPFTVFAPTNAAFSNLLADLGVSSLDDLTAEQLKPILLYHVVSGKVKSTSLTEGYVSTLSEGVSSMYNSLLVELNEGVMLNGSSKVTTADLDASNGVIHIIDKVLLPPTVVDAAINNSNFSILVEAVVKADLATTLKGDGPFTVFAPTNAAFEALFTDLGVTGIADLSAETLTPILLYHVLGSSVFAEDLDEGYVSTLSPGAMETKAQFLVELEGGAMLNGNTNISLTDVVGTNGVIHVIDKVLLPPTVVDIASSNADFSILVEAVIKANLATTLQGDGPFTVFAPTNAAFEALFTDLGVSGIADLSAETLTPILLYHVVDGNVLSTDLSTGDVATLNPATIAIDISSGVTINSNSNVVLADVQGANGVVHVIDKVLLPPSE